MSFQILRLGGLALAVGAQQQQQQPHLHLPHHHHILQPQQFHQQHHVPQQQSPPQEPVPVQPQPIPKQPYGSGDHDDGYTLVFPNIEAFHAWRRQEEETQMVEFVKGDTHGSKAVPPRFKDHTKLVCARHSRSGRKKYVKKHPERVRKVPSRKLEGQGCSASISYKTYFDSDVVRACYVSQHSHEVGVANLPYTRRGRKAAVQIEKEKSKRFRSAGVTSNGAPTVANPAPASISSPTNTTGSGGPNYATAVSMLAPLPPQPPQPGQATHFTSPPPPPHPFGAPQSPPHDDRWDRMSVLYNAIRDHARSGFDYPGPSVAALESVLIRLYLESPVSGVLMGINGGGPVSVAGSAAQPQQQQPGVGPTHVPSSGRNDNGVDGMTNGVAGP